MYDYIDENIAHLIGQLHHMQLMAQPHQDARKRGE
jgi:hypothetical protein